MKSARLPIRLNCCSINLSRQPRPQLNNVHFANIKRQSTPAKRLFTSTCAQRAKSPFGQDEIQAAAEIDFATDAPEGDKSRRHNRKTLRVIPASPSYFSSRPTFTDDYLRLEAVLRRHLALPTVKPTEAPRVQWLALDAYQRTTGEQIKVTKYGRILKLLRRMNLIHPDLMPAEVAAAMDAWRSDVQPHKHKPFPIVVDEFGRAAGLGRRKSSSAKAWLVEGEGEVLVNGKSLSQAFGRLHDRESAIWPLKATGRVDVYNVFATVFGGGSTGQAEAVTLAIARALMVHEPLLKPVLRRAGCVTRDPRRVERKKPGKRKARKMPAWVKR